MKKLTLTESKNKTLKIAAIVTASLAIAGPGFYIFNRSEAGSAVKDWITQRLCKSIIESNNYQFKLVYAYDNNAVPKTLAAILDEAVEMIAKALEETA